MIKRCNLKGTAAVLIAAAGILVAAAGTANAATGVGGGTIFHASNNAVTASPDSYAPFGF
jgi:hypothetical protein